MTFSGFFTKYIFLLFLHLGTTGPFRKLGHPTSDTQETHYDHLSNMAMLRSLGVPAKKADLHRRSSQQIWILSQGGEFLP